MKKIGEHGTVTINVKVIVTDEKDIALYKSGDPRKGLYLSSECTDETLVLLREFFGEEIREAQGCMLDTSKEQ